MYRMVVTTDRFDPGRVADVGHGRGVHRARPGPADRRRRANGRRCGPAGSSASTSPSAGSAGIADRITAAEAARDSVEETVASVERRLESMKAAHTATTRFADLTRDGLRELSDAMATEPPPIPGRGDRRGRTGRSRRSRRLRPRSRRSRASGPGARRPCAPPASPTSRASCARSPTGSRSCSAASARRTRWSRPRSCWSVARSSRYGRRRGSWPAAVAEDEHLFAEPYRIVEVLVELPELRLHVLGSFRMAPELADDAGRYRLVELRSCLICLHDLPRHLMDREPGLQGPQSVVGSATPLSRGLWWSHPGSIETSMSKTGSFWSSTGKR